jgi:hypothetical protein
MNMKQLRMVILLLTACSILYACPRKEAHYFITFVNKSDKDIACQMFWSGNITSADTLFQCGLGANRIPADSLCNYPNGSHSGGWESDFGVIPFIQFLVMNDEIFWQHHLEPCDTIRKYVPILHRYQLTLEDLQRMNWTVVYPPK